MKKQALNGDIIHIMVFDSKRMYPFKRLYEKTWGYQLYECIVQEKEQNHWKKETTQ